MDTKKYNEKQKRDLLVTELDKNMFVEAGAGAGKTTIIVTRIINQLKSGIKPGEIVAITFTNAATHELKERIITSAHKAAKDTTLTGIEKANIENAIKSIDQMQISTIHSFCNRILSEKMLAAKLPMNLRLLEEDELTALKDSLFTQWAENLRRRDWDILLKSAGWRSDALFRLKNLTDKLIGLSDDMNIKISFAPVSESDFLAGTSQLIREVESKMMTLAGNIDRTTYKKIDDIPDERLSKQGKAIRNAIASNDALLAVGEILKPNTNKSFTMKSPSLKDIKAIHKLKDDNDAKNLQAKFLADDDAIRDYIDNSRIRIAPIYGGYVNADYAPYIDYALDAKRFFLKNLPAGVLTNDLLIQKTQSLILSSDETREFFSKKFKCFYVDEFQDTDHVQESFIWTLASKSLDGTELRDGALFVVGDPKQSIYRFRGAEPAVYFTTKSKMLDASNGYVVELADNYRSNDRIINWVNKEFSTKTITVGNPYIPMNISKKLDAPIPNDVLAGVYKYQSPISYKEGTSVYSDSIACSNLILNLINGNYRIPKYNDDTKSFEYIKIDYSDFLILCMNMGEMDTYAETFRSFGIPVVMDSKQDFSTDRHLGNFIRLFAYLIDPFDVSAKTGAYEVIAVNAKDDEALILSVLKKIIEDTEDMNPKAKISYLMNHLELIISQDVDLEDYDIYAVQTRIIQMCEKVITKKNGNGRAILKAMEDYIAVKVEHEVQLNENLNAVRFMNLHKAKGLEGNIVIWTNRTESRRFSKSAYSVGTDYYPEISVKTPTGSAVKWVGYNQDSKIEAEAEAEYNAEKVRLEYVAVTRAKQVFIFMDRLGDAKKTPMFTEGYDLTDLPSIEEIVNAKANKTVTGTAVDIRLAPPKPDTSVLSEPLFSPESPSDYEKESAGLDNKGERTAGELERPVGNIFGLVMHRCFELIMNRFFDKTADNPFEIKLEDLLAGCIHQAINEYIAEISESEEDIFAAFLTEAVMEFGAWFKESDYYKNSEKIYTELPFSYFFKKEDTNVWMHGSADVVIRLNNGEFIVLDYKSDSDESYETEEGFEERLRGKYSPQIEAYKSAVTNVFDVNEDMIKSFLISFSQKDLVDGHKLRVRVTAL